METRILIVDDDPFICRQLEELYSSQQYAVSSAPNAPEALRLLQEHEFSLAVVDLKIPGTDGIGLTRDDIVRFLGYPLVIFSGDQDIDGTSENFPRHDTAMAQGPNRFARALFYLEHARAEAAKLGVPCRWSRVVVPGVAHEGMRMSAFAGDHWFGARG